MAEEAKSLKSRIGQLQVQDRLPTSFGTLEPKTSTELASKAWPI